MSIGIIKAADPSGKKLEEKGGNSMYLYHKIHFLLLKSKFCLESESHE